MRPEMVTEKGQDLILRTANELFGKEKLIKETWYFDAECDDIPDEN